MTRIHQPEIADILRCWETQVLVLGQAERCYYRRPREVTRVALKIVLLVVNASILSFKSTAAILPQSPDNSGTIDVRFPVPSCYQQYATQDGNPAPSTGRLLLLLPSNFDSQRAWPILIVTATKDPGHTGPSDAPWYRAAAAAEGWIVLARMQRSAPETTQ